MENVLVLQKISYDEGFIEHEEDKDKKEGFCCCYFDKIAMFNIMWDKNGYYWITERFFPSCIFDKYGNKHPINNEIRKYLRVELKTKKEVMDACEKLFNIYLSLFFIKN
jgi:hypothetical protein